MTKRRDLTQAQFDRACRQRNFRPSLMGYYNLGDTPVSVCAANGGPTRRQKLSYLIREHDRALEKYGDKR